MDIGRPLHVLRPLYCTVVSLPWPTYRPTPVIMPSLITWQPYLEQFTAQWIGKAGWLEVFSDGTDPIPSPNWYQGRGGEKNIELQQVQHGWAVDTIDTCNSRIKCWIPTCLSKRDSSTSPGFPDWDTRIWSQVRSSCPGGHQNLGPLEEKQIGFL